MNVPWNKVHNGNQMVQAWMDKYYATKPSELDSFGIGINNSKTDIYITTFGSDFFIPYQIKTLRKFFEGRFYIIVIDTNEDLYPEVSEKIRTLCWNEDCGYIKMPPNHYQEKQHFDSTMKLGTVLNWVFHNIIKERQPKYFGILDHDCMLFRNFNIIPWLDDMGIYGTVSRNLPKWNIHVTQTFFKYDFVKDLPLDFRASHKHGLDTFGASYDILFHRLKMEDYQLTHIGMRFAEEDVVSKDNVQHHEIIDDCWIHLCASTHDQLRGEGQRKLDYFRGFLNRSLLD